MGSKQIPSVKLVSTSEPRNLARYLHRSIVFREPDRLVHPPFWLEHIPFAFWMVDGLQPTRFVELGTQASNSYAAFAQAVDALRLPTACYSIDTWKGGLQAGPHDEKVFDRWRDYHDRHFSSFSRLIRASVAEAVSQFADDSIDLLHLDGYHSLSDVRDDFTMWLPKMSHRGVVLLHDINVREQNFSAWEFWRQAERAYPSFSFLHGQGLGVLGVGRDFPEPVTWLLSRRSDDSTELSEIRLFFSQLGRRVSLQYECARRARTIRALRSRLRSERGDQRSDELEIADLESERAEREQDVRALESRLSKECQRRDQTIGDLDAEARALASQLQNARTQMPARRWRFRPRANVRGGPAAHRSQIWRGAAVLRTAPTILAKASRSGDVGRSVRAVWRFLASPRTLSNACIVARSGVFDEAYYSAENPDVTGSRISPLIHYVLWGAFEGRRPNAMFDPAYYLEQYPDVARSRCEPLSHFLLHGTSEERNPGPDFDSKYYLSTNPDVRESGVNPLVHFVNIGWREGRSPLPSLDSVEASLPASPRVQLTSRAIHLRRPDRPVIVCLTHVCPFPPHAGNAYRINRMLRSLQNAGFRIVPIIVPLGGEDPNNEAVRQVEEQFANVVVIDRSGAIRYALTDVPDVLASLDREHTPRYSAVLGEDASMSGRTRELLIIDRTYCHDAAIAAVMRLHSVLGPYIFMAEYVWMTRVLPLLDDRAVKVLDTHDVYCTKKDKVLSFGIRDFWLEPEEEAKRLALADLVVAIQDGERKILQQLTPNGTVITAGIDFDLVGDPLLPDGRRILYVGSGNPMNVRGLHDFLKFAWPAILTQVPEAELLVAGPVGEAVAGEHYSHVRVPGVLANLDETYRCVRVVINPALAGTGYKIKTVEALSHLRPIVTWPTGVDGLPDSLVDLCDIVHDWFEFGSRVVTRLVTDRERAFSPADQQTVERAISPKTVYADLLANIRELWDRRVASADAAAAGD